MVFVTILRQAAQKRVPMIRFRKGGPVMSAPAGSQSHAAGSSAVSSSAPPQLKSSAAAARPVLEDYELPPRYRRKPIDPDEMEYINRGGPPM